MKYMGSKRAMLQNGLGDLLSSEVANANRFVDLFSGSGAVATYVAQRFPNQVLAFDLQKFCVILAQAVLCRRKKLDSSKIWSDWHHRAKKRTESTQIPVAARLTQSIVTEFRVWCANQSQLAITKAYGGHYYSPLQVVWLDSLRSTLPMHEPERTVALAALIEAASRCAAAPGHTAQPFQPTRTAKRFLIEAWERDIVRQTQVAFGSLAAQFAQRLGNARIADANEVAKELRDDDLAFIDPPYSGVHYSRFYHVLETIADGSCDEVFGVGRYPAPEFRPRSKYSVQSESSDALDQLLMTVATRGATAILTFPDHECSNGLSGEQVRDIAGKYFRLREQTVESRFSTLGGTSGKGELEAGRAARQTANELILVLRPR